MKDFKHRHIMPLIGVCLDSGVGVVMPYMANGSVLNYLKEKRESLLLSDEAEIDQVRSCFKQKCSSIERSLAINWPFILIVIAQNLLTYNGQ